MNKPFSFFNKKPFELVVSKIEESDFFTTKMVEYEKFFPDFNFYFSAFLSAARSTTYTLQFVMADYPGFSNWWPDQSEKIRKNKLARYFHTLRNEDQKRGIRPYVSTAYSAQGKIIYEHNLVYSPLSDAEHVPNGDLKNLCMDHLKNIISTVAECYREFDIYCDPRMLFCQEGLKELCWAIDDLEEYLGLPRGWTDIEPTTHDTLGDRLRVLRQHARFEEALEPLIKKYKVQIRPPRNL